MLSRKFLCPRRVESPQGDPRPHLLDARAVHERDEAETARLVRELLAHDQRRLDLAVLRKEGGERVIVGLRARVSVDFRCRNTKARATKNTNEIGVARGALSKERTIAESKNQVPRARDRKSRGSRLRMRSSEKCKPRNRKYLVGKAGDKHFAALVRREIRVATAAAAASRRAGGRRVARRR
jgi:hypothetical protein